MEGEFGESEMSEPSEGGLSVDSSESEYEKKARIYEKVNEADESDDSDIDAALNTIKQQEQKPQQQATEKNEQLKAQAYLTQRKVFDTFLH